MHEPLGGVPDDVADGVFGVDAEKVLEDAKEGDFLRRLGDLLEDGVEDVKRGVEVDAVGALEALGVIAFALLVEDVELDGELGLGLGAFSKPFKRVIE